MSGSAPPARPFNLLIVISSEVPEFSLSEQWQLGVLLDGATVASNPSKVVCWGTVEAQRFVSSWAKHRHAAYASAADFLGFTPDGLDARALTNWADHVLLFTTVMFRDNDPFFAECAYLVKRLGRSSTTLVKNIVDDLARIYHPPYIAQDSCVRGEENVA